MQSENAIALKEWAAVCAAIAAGRQTILLRKGGIAEGPGGFRIDHPEFWLSPTQFHQSASQLSEEGAAFLEASQTWKPAAGELRLDLYAIVEAVAFIADESRLAELAPFHVLSDDTVRERFHYRRPGVFAVAIRAMQLPRPIELPEPADYAGCHSWVTLPVAVPTAGLTPLFSGDGVSHAVRIVCGLATAN